LIQHLTLSASTIIAVVIADDIDVRVDDNATGSRYCRGWWFFSTAATATAIAVAVAAAGAIRLLAFCV